MRSTGMDTTAACTGRIRRGASASLIGMLPIFSAFGTSFDARADELHYQSFWVEGRATSLHTAALSLARFKATGQKLAETGHVLIDVETAVRDGQRRYAGLWTLGSGSTIFEGPIGAIPMREAMQRRSAQGLRLVDFETFETASGRRQYLGVWRPGTGEQVLTAPMSQQAFVARGQQFVQQGMRLRDVEVENRDGRLMYSGLFRSGAGLNLLTPPMSMAQFRDALAARRADGQELLDFETIEGTPNVVGVFRSGDALAEITGSRDFTAQFALAQSKFNDGRRTRDFELTVIETPEAGGGATDPDNPARLAAQGCRGNADLSGWALRAARAPGGFDLRASARRLRRQHAALQRGCRRLCAGLGAPPRRYRLFRADWCVHRHAGTLALPVSVHHGGSIRSAPEP